MGGTGEDLLFHLLRAIGIETRKNGQILQKILELEEERANAIEGKPFANRFTIPAGSQVVKIHMENAGEYSDTHPRDVSFYLPGRPVASLYIYNEGPSSLNYSYNDGNYASSLLLSGEDRQITFTKRLIKSLNFVAAGATTVRFEAIA